ncbi:MAG: GAF domain-containing protein [Endomicrobia bacterium]|nr:GAF domain-containing protein [Endomicrobiia bacterium]
MKKNIIKYLIVTMLMLIAAVLIWIFVVYHWFQSTVQKSLNPVVAKARSELSAADAAPSRDSKDQMRLYFTDLEQSEEIVTYAFLNEDKSVNYAEGLRKRENVLWALNVIYPVTVGDKIVGWIKVWPSPELVASSFLTGKNILIVLASLLLSVILVFGLAAVYVAMKFIAPISDFKQAIKSISNGNSLEIRFKYKSGIWKEMGESLKKLNSKVIDINTTVQMLFSVSKALTFQIDMNRIFNVIMSIIQKKFPDAMCAVILPGEDGSLKITAKRGYSQKFFKSIKVEEGNPIADAFIMGKMVAVKDLKAIDEKLVKDFLHEGAVTQINTPLMDENNLCLGVLNVSGKNGDIFNTDIADTISTVGKYLSIALKNVKLYDKVQELNRRLETEVNTASNELIQTNARLIRKVRDIKALYDISAFASAKFNLNGIMHIVIDKIMELTGMETTAVLVKNEKNGDFVFLEDSFGIKSENLAKFSFNAGNSDLINTLEEKKTTVVFNSLMNLKQGCPEFLKVIPMSSAVFVPIKHNDGVIGIILPVNKFGSEISDNDVKIVEHIAVLLSGVVEKVKLYSELEKKVKDLTFLQRISSAIESAPDVEKTLAKIIEVTKDAFEADLCAVLLYDKHSGRLMTQKGAYFTGGQDKVMLTIDKDDQNSLSAKTFREGVPYLSADATVDPAIKSQSAQQWGIKSIIIVPLIVDGEVIGVLRVGKHVPDAYSEEDKNLIVMIANQAAIIIENANLYDELSRCQVR